MEVRSIKEVLNHMILILVKKRPQQFSGQYPNIPRRAHVDTPLEIRFLQASKKACKEIQLAGALILDL